MADITRRTRIICIAIVALLVLAGAAQVTRQEFNELSKRVEALEQSVKIQDWHIMALRKKIVKFLKDHEPQKDAQTSDTANGKQLLKLSARQVIEIMMGGPAVHENKYREFLTGHRVQWMGSVAWVRLDADQQWKVAVLVDSGTVRGNWSVSFMLGEKAAANLRKGQPLRFRGIIESTRARTFTLSDAEIYIGKDKK